MKFIAANSGWMAWDVLDDAGFTATLSDAFTPFHDMHAFFHDVQAGNDFVFGGI